MARYSSLTVSVALLGLVGCGDGKPPAAPAVTSAAPTTAGSGEVAAERAKLPA